MNYKSGEKIEIDHLVQTHLNDIARVKEITDRLWGNIVMVRVGFPGPFSNYGEIKECKPENLRHLIMIDANLVEEPKIIKNDTKRNTRKPRN